MGCIHRRRVVLNCIEWRRLKSGTSSLSKSLHNDERQDADYWSHRILPPINQPLQTRACPNRRYLPSEITIKTRCRSLITSNPSTHQSASTDENMPKQKIPAKWQLPSDSCIQTSRKTSWQRQVWIRNVSKSHIRHEDKVHKTRWGRMWKLHGAWGASENTWSPRRGWHEEHLKTPGHHGEGGMRSIWKHLVTTERVAWGASENTWSPRRGWHEEHLKTPGHHGEGGMRSIWKHLVTTERVAWGASENTWSSRRGWWWFTGGGKWRMCYLSWVIRIEPTQAGWSARIIQNKNGLQIVASECWSAKGNTATSNDREQDCLKAIHWLHVAMWVGRTERVLKHLFRTCHALVKNSRTFTDYMWLCELDAQKGFWNTSSAPAMLLWRTHGHSLTICAYVSWTHRKGFETLLPHLPCSCEELMAIHWLYVPMWVGRTERILKHFFRSCRALASFNCDEVPETSTSKPATRMKISHK